MRWLDPERWAHGQAVRRRLSLTMVLCVATALSSNMVWLSVAAITGAGAFMVSGFIHEWTRSTLLRRLLALNVFVALLWAALPWTWSANTLTWDLEGTELAVLLSVRIEALALWTLALLGPLDVHSIVRELQSLGFPKRLGHLLMLTLRYLDVMHDTRKRIDRAMRARGSGNPPSCMRCSDSFRSSAVQSECKASFARPSATSPDFAGRSH